jgi:N-acyl-D-amino-acid deacylase
MTMMRTALLVCVVGVLAACGQPASAPQPASDPRRDRLEQNGPFDVLITGGRIVDGTGAPWYRGDVGIVGDRIVAIGQLAGRDAKQLVDASNLVVAPGFIDMLGQSEFNVLADPRAASKITQGITTEITGEHQSIAPVNDEMAKAEKAEFDRYKVEQDFRTLAEYFAWLERTPAAINVGTFVGAGGVRRYIVGLTE